MSAAKVDLYDKAAKISSKIIIKGAPSETQSADSPKLDEIEADSHETFTLEEIRALIINYRKKNKDFLIARVSTRDPEQNDVMYNFYYAAGEINRILFKYESRRRLLHRIKVRNPLNNMYIEGQVFYYKIPVSDVDQALVNYYFGEMPEEESTRKAFSAVNVQSTTESMSETEEESKPAKDCLDIKSKSTMELTQDEKTAGELIDSINRGLLPLPVIKHHSPQIVYSATYFANDDDFLYKSEIREYFRQNALEANDDFLYEIDRTQNDFNYLLDEESGEISDDASDWRRIFSAHISIAFTLLFICLVMGGGVGAAIIFIPIVILIFLSFIGSLLYVLLCRRSSFDTQAVNSFDEENM
ncbi:hypothetical protein ENBRE01_2610 [Enteropsectra breve]|nr:hypothetical protein ENBRE01_2610 [Enteropsectra breve]